MEESERNSVRADELRPIETNDIEMITNSPKNLTPSSPDSREQVKKKRIRLRLPLARLRRRKAVVQMDGGSLFGRSVADLFQGETLNPQLMWLLKILHEEGPSASGIFRRTSNINVCRKIKIQMENGAECEQINVYMASNVLKEVLRSLSDCVLCCDKYDQWLDGHPSKEFLKRMVDGLPSCNRHLLRHLICVLHAIQRNVDVTMMSSHSLAICFGPSLLWSRTPAAAATATASSAPLDGQKASDDVTRMVANVGRVIAIVEALIDNAEAVFGADCLRLLQGTTAAAADQSVITETAGDGEYRTQIAGACRAKNPAAYSSTEPVSVIPVSSSERPVAPPVAPPRRRRSIATPFATRSLRTADDESARLDFLADLSNHIAKAEQRPAGCCDERLTSLESDASSWSELQMGDHLAESTDNDALEDSVSYEEISVTEEELDDREERRGRQRRFSMFAIPSDYFTAAAAAAADKEDSSVGGNRHHHHHHHPGGRRDLTGDRQLLLQQRYGRSVSVDYVETPTTTTTSKRHPTKRPEATMDRETDSGGLSGATVALQPVRSSREDAAPPVDRYSSSSDHLKSLNAESAAAAILSTETESRTTRPPYKSFSSTDELLDYDGLVGGGGRRRKKGYSANSFSSTAGSEADVSTFGESMDGGDGAFAHRSFFPAPENRKSSSCSVVSGERGSRAVSSTVEGKVDGGEEKRTNPVITMTTAAAVDKMTSRDQARYSVERGSAAIEVDGGDAHQSTINSTDDDDVRQHPGISSRSSPLVGRSVPEAKQRRGMTGTGSDFFPTHLSKTYSLKKAHLCSSDALDYDSASGTESGVDAAGFGGRSAAWTERRPRGKASPADDGRLVESDLETVVDHRRWESNQRHSEPVVVDAARRWDSDAGERRCAYGRRNSVEKTKNENFSSLPQNHEERSREGETPPRAADRLFAPPGEGSKRESGEVDEVMQGTSKARTETVLPARNDNAKTAAPEVTRSCGDLLKAFDLFLVNVRSSEQDQLRHHLSIGSIADSGLQKKLQPLPSRKPRHLLSTGCGDTSAGDSSSSSSDESRRIEDGQTKRKRRRSKRPRRSRGSDTRIQAVRKNNLVNLVRSKSDSNALCRTELIIKKESNYSPVGDRQQRAGLFTKYAAGRSNMNLPADDKQIVVVKVVSPDLEAGKCSSYETQDKENELNLAELLSTKAGTTTSRCRQQQVTMGDHGWHAELADDVSCSKKNLPSAEKYGVDSQTPTSGSRGGKAAKQLGLFRSQVIGLHENKGSVNKIIASNAVSQSTDEPSARTRSNHEIGAPLDRNTRATGNTVGRTSEGGATETKAGGKFRGGECGSRSEADGRKVSVLERNRRMSGKSADNLPTLSSLARISSRTNEADDLCGVADLSENDSSRSLGNRRRAHSFRIIAGELSAAASPPPTSHGVHPSADDLNVKADSREYSLRTVESIKKDLLSGGGGRPCDQIHPRHSHPISHPQTAANSRDPGNSDSRKKSLNRSVSLLAQETPPSHSLLHVYDPRKSESHIKGQKSERQNESEQNDGKTDSSKAESRSAKDTKYASDTRTIDAHPKVSKIAGEPSFRSSETRLRDRPRPTSYNSAVLGETLGSGFGQSSPTKSYDNSSDEGSSESSSTRADSEQRAPKTVVRHTEKREMPWSVASIRSYFGGQDSV